MRTDRMKRATLAMLGAAMLPAALLGSMVGCGPISTPARELETIRLDSAEAARWADAARNDVPAQMADGLELELWAAEPLLIDPIALAVDDRGRVYVTGSNRSNIIVDIRWHPEWTTDVLAFETVDELRSFYRREMAPERSEQNAEWLPDLNEDGSHDWHDLTVQTERIYRIRDASGDGLADTSELLFEGLNTEVTDVAGGLLVRDDDIYLAAAPDLWRLRITSGDGGDGGGGGDGVIDSQESISHGYSVHPGLFGHGVSGVTLGPDGRIYWGVGDMGFTVVDQDGRRWSYPNQGAILRAEPDGSGFEVFATGLRNTHEFAFDEYGNLISVDNDGDLPPDEAERVVHVVEGSDSGWRVNWQFGKYTEVENNDYNAWMREGLFKPRFAGQAAYITPPIASYRNGPAGMAYNPGVALGERWRDHFFVTLFNGTPATSSVRAFRLEPKGATFELARDTVVLSGTLTVGIEFGPDGALYLADWVEGWASTGRGRIWKLDDPVAAASELRAETRALLADPFDERSEEDLAALLAHDDMRVRIKAQLELARRGAARTLEDAARGSFSQRGDAGSGVAGQIQHRSSSPQRGEAGRAVSGRANHRLARIHGLWGIGQLARADAKNAEPLVRFLGDDDAEVRAQAAKTLGDVRFEPAANALISLLADPAPRVRFFAAEALGRIGHRPAVQPLIAMLEANDDEDAYLRHAGSLALARIGDAEPLIALADHGSRAVRIAAVVALRRMQHHGVARFLHDSDEYIVTEAARAINDDGSIEAALPELARVLEEPRFQNEALLRRALNANFRVGTAEAAHRVADFALRDAAPEVTRVEAITMLGVWPKPSPLDRVVGKWRGRIERDPSTAQMAAARLVTPMLSEATPALKVAFAETAGRLGLDAAVSGLLARVQIDRAPEVRIAALNALRVLEAPPIEAAARAAISDADADVRKAALALIPELGLPHESTVELLASVLERGPLEEKQSALQALGTVTGRHAHPVLAALLDQLISGELAPELELELSEAVDASNAAELKGRLVDHRAAIAEGDPAAAFREALHGGNAGRGKEVVLESQEAQCTRCHLIEEHGSKVGPELSRIGATLTRQQILEALIDPSARIAPGFGSAPSAMPSMERILGPRELRDVVEYLSGLKP